MNARHLFPLLPAAALSCAAAFAAPQPGIQKFYQDWTAACDNRLNCEAVSLREDSLPDDRLSLNIARDARSGDTVVVLNGVQSKSDRYRILIDQRVADSGPIDAIGGDSIRIGGAEAVRLSRQIARGATLVLQDGDGAELGAVSLSGSKAALGHIDRMQNRAGTRTALALLGKRALPPKWLPAPNITVKRIVPGKNTPDATALVALVEGSACKEARYGVTEDSATSLGKTRGTEKALVLISCGSGAYNFTSVAYIGSEDTPGKWRFDPARFDYRAPANGDDVPYLVNVDWNPATQILSSFSKGRGLGDCGNAESYVWDGDMFRLTSAIAMQECRGSMDWLTLWHAEIAYTD